MGATARWLQAQFRIAGERVLVDADTPRLGRDHLLEAREQRTKALAKHVHNARKTHPKHSIKTQNTENTRKTT